MVAQLSDSTGLVSMPETDRPSQRRSGTWIAGPLDRLNCERALPACRYLPAARSLLQNTPVLVRRISRAPGWCVFARREIAEANRHGPGASRPARRLRRRPAQFLFQEFRGAPKFSPAMRIRWREEIVLPGHCGRSPPQARSPSQ